MSTTRSASSASRGSRRRCRARAGSGCPRGRQPSTRSRRTFAPVASSACSKRDLLLGRERGRRSPRRRASSTLVRVSSSIVLLLPPLVRAEAGVLARLLALQVALRERRAVVGRVGLAADEQDRALAALLAQPARAVRRREAAADEQEVDAAVGHASGRARAGADELRRDRRPRAQGRARAAPRRRPRSRCRPWARSRRPSRRIEMIRLPSGSAMSATARPAAGASSRDLHLDDLEPLLGQVEQVHEAVLGHLVLDQAQDQVGRGDRGLDAEQLEVLEVPRVVARGR